MLFGHLSVMFRIKGHLTRTHALVRYHSGNKPWRVLFFGSDGFALTHLKALRRATGSIVESIDVVSVSLKTTVGEYCTQNKLNLEKWPVTVKPGSYDVGVVVSFGRLIPKDIINAITHGVINVHPSLLPRWRGASPIPRTILNSDKHTGVTLIDIEPERYDVGPILLQESVMVPDDCTFSELGGKLAHMGADMLIQALRDLINLKKNAVTQTNSNIKVSHARRINSGMAEIRWSSHDARDIWLLYRAFGELYDLRSYWDSTRVKLLEMVNPAHLKVPENKLNAPHGSCFYSKKEQLIFIKCKDGWVAFRNIYVKKKLSASSFYNGYLSKPHHANTLFESTGSS